MLQKLQAKQSRYLEAMKNDVDVLDVSDISTSELKTALITNPNTRAEIEVKIEQKRLESEKSRLIADSSFVLRKYESVLEVRDKIAERKREMNNHIEWSSENNVNAEYWANEINVDKLKLNNLQEELKIEVKKLEDKGINVSAIESNLELTEKKVKSIEDKIENLPNWKAELERKYKLEKTQKDKLNTSQDFIKERANENKSFYKSTQLLIEDLEKENNIEAKQEVRRGRRR